MQRGSYELHYMNKFLIAHPTSKIGDAQWSGFLAECVKVGISEINARRFVESLAPRSATTVTPYKVTAPQAPVVAPKQAPAPSQVPRPKPVQPTPSFPYFTPRTAPPAAATPKPVVVPEPTPKAVSKASAPQVRADPKPEPKAPAKEPEPNYDDMSKKDLLALAKKKGIEADAKFTKSKIISLLK